ncbi:hypothetical protein P7K49_012527 [Saguinus oedipus]|uniref:Uncharacterized protein n=1 Tax=Saguinus oedipus TaxID=9490 RepID=A0ABQ9VUC2_SAGOE|nr:hypothetical protein P7K49_012527 [Saguinus oedipus]
MRLGSSTDKKDSGRLHVDFAQARDDFYEWECKQRMRAREERHRRKLEEDRLRPPSPPAIMHYSEHEAALLAEKLKGMGHLRWLFFLHRDPQTCTVPFSCLFTIDPSVQCLLCLRKALRGGCKRRLFTELGGVSWESPGSCRHLGSIFLPGTEPCPFPACLPVFSMKVYVQSLNRSH